MRGILSAAAYLPHGRLDRSTISAFVGSGGGRGTRTVASYDEDTTTMGFELAISQVSTPEAVPQVAAEPEADLERPEPSDAECGAEADAFHPVPPAQNKPRSFPF